MAIAPTLILGLGGTGSKVIMKVAEKVDETGTAQRDRIAFVAFDTDQNELQVIKREMPRIYTVQTSTRNTVGEYLNINTNARDNWFPVNEMLNRKTLTEGAAQVRAISRLAFDTTLKGGHLEPLHQAIEHLFRIDKDQEEQALRVIITSSLAGGTGSGLILPVAMYLANFLRTKYPKAKAITRGFFLQPDVFYKVIPGTEEQQNLQVNAYATVRELDAFLMKGDNTLPEQYRDLAFEFPRVAAEGVESVHAMPYDFCFLFDAANAMGGTLDSFAGYLDHAATCIYTQSIGPMSTKSNSREDNVLREVIKNDGRNRYSGAGASRLVYPWQHVREYVANKWADQALSTQWLKFDEQFKIQQEGLAKQREKGHPAKDLDLTTYFIQAVDSAAATKDGFAKAIQSQCLAYDEDGISVIGQRWNEYVGALKGHVERHSVVPADEVLKRNADASISALAETADSEDYVATYVELKRFHDLVERHAEEQAGVLGYTIFQAKDEGITKERHSHQLETYLRDKITNKFIHPVSARYFLYQTLQSLIAEKRTAQVELDALIEFFDNFEKSTFDDPSTEDEEGAAEFQNRKKGLRERLRNKPGADLQAVADQLRTYLKKIDRMRELMVYVSVLDEGIDYTQGLADSFRVFFDALATNLRRLKVDVDTLHTKYDNTKGSTTRYVLASSDCLDSLYHVMPYTGGVVSIDSDLAEDIYNKVRQYYMLADEKDENYFQDLYKKTIIGYFADQVMASYGSLVKMDVIEALEREYRVTEKNFEETKLIHHVVGEINKAKRLAAPFLEQPLGEERHPISACAYNPVLEGDSDPNRKSFVEENLGNYGGAPDENITPQEILFYNAIYGIRARDLSKYTPERVDATDRRPAGQYFRAYYQLVSGIRPSVTETKVITPHIDRRWHTVAVLPDLDEGNHRAQVKRIHTAFLVGLAHQVIKWEASDNTRIYKYEPRGGGDQPFFVSNGTPCDKYYEVLDSLMIDPVAVNDIIATTERMEFGHREETRAADFDSSLFARAIGAGIALPELSKTIPGFEHRKASIFDVAAFYCVSAPKDEIFDSLLRELAADLVGYVKEQVENGTDAGEFISVLERVLRQQFEQFRANADIYLGEEGPAFARRLRVISRPLWEVLDDLHIRALANEVQAFSDGLLATP